MYCLVISVVLLAAASSAVDLGSCKQPLGLESGTIKDAAITASSSYDKGNVGPHLVRLRQEKNGGAWCPREQVMRGVKEWIEIDLQGLHTVSAVQTQGRFGNGQGVEYVEEFKLEYWRPGLALWRPYRRWDSSELFTANSNTYTVVENPLDPVIIATKIRLIPYSLHRRTVCLRMELKGCRYEDGVISYSSPQGDVFLDEAYDGIYENEYLKGGKGQLTDGKTGGDDATVDYNGYGKGYEWVGWQNRTDAKRRGVLELTFEFDTVRNFSRVDIHTNNNFKHNIQVFSELRILSSITGRHFSYDSPIHYVYMPDEMLETARNVSVHLHHTTARYLKFQFTFASEWLLISEVYFHSEPVEGNFSEEIRNNRGHVPTEEKHNLQRDAVISTKSATDENVAVTTEEGSSRTSIIIGIMSTIIFALLSAVIAMSVRNCKQNGVLSRLQSSFAGIRIKNVGLGLKGQRDVDFHFEGSDNSEPLYAPVANDEPSHHLDGGAIKVSSTVYNDPYGADNRCYYNAPSRDDHISNGQTDVPVIPDYDTPAKRMIGQSAVRQPPHGRAQPERRASIQRTSYTRAVVERQSFPVQSSHVPTSPSNTIRSTETPSSMSTGSNGFYATANLFSMNEHHQRAGSATSCRETSSDDNENSIATHCEIDNRLPLIPSSRLRRGDRLSSGHFTGEVYLDQLTLDDEINVNVLSRQLPSHFSRSGITKEYGALFKLRHSNLLPLLGLVDDEVQPEYGRTVVIDYGNACDLCHYLQEHVAETSPIGGRRILTTGSLLYLGTQIAAAMEYLESQNIVHRDLATRNCVVGDNHSVKIATSGFNVDAYQADYFHVHGHQGLVPLRWMAWESVKKRKFSARSDVWSFGVLLWEILTFARDQPLEHLTDEEVLQLLMHYDQHGPDEMLLESPIQCGKEIYELMCECWRTNDMDRPTFKEIHMFLKRKNLGYNPETN